MVRGDGGLDARQHPPARAPLRVCACSTLTPPGRRAPATPAISTGVTTRWPTPTAISRRSIRFCKSQLEKVDSATTYANATPTARRLDAMSMRDWIDAIRPKRPRRCNWGGSSQNRIVTSTGATSRSSARSIWFCSSAQQRHYAENHEMNVLGYSDQRYIFANGSQALPEAIAAWLPAGSVRLGYRLARDALDRRAGATCCASTIAERLRASPPTASYLRCRSSPCARSIIRAHGLRLGEDQRDREPRLRLSHEAAPPVRPARLDARDSIPGPSRRPDRFGRRCACRARSIFRSGKRATQGLIEVFTASNPAMLDTPPMPYARIADATGGRAAHAGVLHAARRIWPGVRATWNGKATFGNAQADPNILASYSCWLVGQCTTIAGHEARRRDAYILPASTRRSRIKDSWRAAPSREFALPARSSRTIASELH